MQNNLKSVRVKMGLTQVQIADKAHMSKRGYQYIEAGKRVPNVYLAIKIAKTLSSTVEEIFPLLGAQKITQLNNNIRKEEKASKKLKVTENDLVSQSEVYK